MNYKKRPKLKRKKYSKKVISFILDVDNERQLYKVVACVNDKPYIVVAAILFYNKGHASHVYGGVSRPVAKKMCKTIAAQFRKMAVVKTVHLVYDPIRDRKYRGFGGRNRLPDWLEQAEKIPLSKF